MPKVILNYRPNERRHLESTLTGLLDEVETGPSRTNSWRMMMMKIWYLCIYVLNGHFLHILFSQMFLI